MGSLPWPRGAPPKFQGSAIQKDAQHWKVGEYVRCAQCGSRTHCEHKSLHAKHLNAKWEEMAEGHDNRPEFFFEGRKWLEQIKQHPELRIGDPLPPGVPRGWEANPGNSEVVIGSPRRHGEWRLVWQQRDSATVNHVDVPTRRSRSTNPVAQKQMHARKEWEESRVPILVDQHALRSVTMTPGGATRYSKKIDELTDPPYSSVQQRDFFLSAHIGKLKHGKIKNSNPTTPDLVQSLNELNRTSTTILPPIANARRNESYNKASASVPAHRRLNEADQQSMSRDVFRAAAPVQHAHISYEDTQRSAVEWMDDTARTARLEKLQQKLPPTLKTKIRQGDVKAADASRDIAEAKTVLHGDPAKQVGRDGLVEPKYRGHSKGQCLENFNWAQSRKPKSKSKRRITLSDGFCL